MAAERGSPRARIYVVGIGYRSFDRKLREIILHSEVILASERLFEIFKRCEEFGTVKDRVEVIDNVDATMNFIRQYVGPSEQGTSDPVRRTIVLLASGDPLFCGIGRRAVEEFGKEIVEIFPDLSSVQVAFAKIREPWDDAFLMSLHPGPAVRAKREPRYGIKDIPVLLREHGKIAVLTGAENNPARIAKEILCSSDIGHALSAIVMYVCERLGYPDEKITEGTVEDIAAMEFREPNVVIIKVCPSVPHA